MWYWFFKFTIFRPLVKRVWRAVIIGEENIPKTGGAIIAANHIANIDSIVVPALLERRLTYPVKAELFSGKTLKIKIVGWFLTAIGQIPMDRSGGEASAKSLENIAAVLKEDHLIAIYPEGTRSVDGRMYRGKTGVARIALLAEAPVIPVGVSGTATKSRFLGINWPGKPQVTVGEPLLFSDQYANKNDPEVLRYVTDEIMAAIQQITGQQYVDIYGYRVKHGDLKNSDCTEFVKERPGD